MGKFLFRVLHQKSKASEMTPRQRPNPSSRVVYYHKNESDFVSRIEYDEKEQECLAKDEQIQVRQSSFLIVISFFFSFLDRFYMQKFAVWNICCI